jgi:hypothetical protein
MPGGPSGRRGHYPTSIVVFSSMVIVAGSAFST